MQAPHHHQQNEDDSSVQPPDQPPDRSSDTIQRLAQAITRAGLHAPVALTLDILKPVDFISSQVALFIHPFVRGYAWERYTAILTEESRWQELRHCLGQQHDSTPHQQHAPESPPEDDTRTG
jgi:hypothetical protein